MVDCSKYPNVSPEVIECANCLLIEYGEEPPSFPCWTNLKIVGVYYGLHFWNEFVEEQMKESCND